MNRTTTPKPAELAKLVRRAGRRGAAVESILLLAKKELEISLRITSRARNGFFGIDPDKREDVASLVIENVWRYWIPEAKRRLATGDWTDSNLISKLRTALCFYSQKKAATLAERIDSRERLARRLRENPRSLAPSEPEPPKLLLRVARRNSKVLEALGRDRAKMALKFLGVVYESTRGPMESWGWTWAKLLVEVCSMIEGWFPE